MLSIGVLLTLHLFWKHNSLHLETLYGIQFSDHSRYWLIVSQGMSSLCASQFQLRASPWANPRHLMHDESRRARHLEFNSVPPPGHLQTTKNLFCNILSSFLTVLKVKGFKHGHFRIRRAFIDHKWLINAIKPFALSLFSWSDSFRDLLYAVLLSWNSYFY